MALRDATSTLLQRVTETKRFDYTVPSLQVNQVQFRLRVRKEIRAWPDYDETFYSDLELFDNPNWSSGVETVSYIGSKNPVTDGPYSVERYQSCDPEGNNCTTVEECYQRYILNATLTNLTWSLPSTNYSTRAKVSGIRNSNAYPVTAVVAGTSYTISPNATVNFAPVPVSQVQIQDQAVTPPVDRICNTVQVPIACPGYVSLGKQSNPMEFYDLESCFADFQATMQLFIQCDVMP
jgi:hypothetical protein